MAEGKKSDKRWIASFLLGTGVGALAVLLLDPRIRARIGNALIESSLDVADRMMTIGRGPEPLSERKEARGERVLNRRIEKMRAAGL
jgi:hypothetical protein